MTTQELFNFVIKINTPRETIVLAACDCARTVLHLVVAKGDNRPLLAIEAAEQWAHSPTEENRKKAEEAARAAYAAVNAANAAYYAAASAAYAATNAATNAAAYAAAYASANAAVVNNQKAYDEAFAKHEKLCCELIMKRIPRLENLMLLAG